MGHHQHDVVLVLIHDWDKPGSEALTKLRSEMPEEYQKYFVGPVVTMNRFSVFALLPDGSKEGWKYSEDMDGWRQRFMEAAKRSEYPDMVHLQFGGDDDQTIIRFTTDKEAFAMEDACHHKSG